MFKAPPGLPDPDYLDESEEITFRRANKWLVFIYCVLFTLDLLLIYSTIQTLHWCGYILGLINSH